MKGLNIIFGLITALCGSLFAEASLAATPPVRVIPEVKHNVSKPLREMTDTQRLIAQPTHQIAPLYKVPLKLNPSYLVQKDEAIQAGIGLDLVTTPGLSFLGLGVGFPGFTVNVIPPDTNASVGLTQIVQWVNNSYVVFNKATGRRILGPLPGNTLWSGFGGLCETSNRGDPIVKYDRIANRWVLTQFAFNTDNNNQKIPPYFQCIAVSTTPDATGTYNRYSFNFGTDFNDYGKLGVWPDAYYMSFVVFGTAPPDFVTAPAQAAEACAYDRTNMLAGNAATMQCSKPTPPAGIFLPADLDGATLPPVGAPNSFVGLFQNANGVTLQDRLAMWKFHVDWKNPYNSRFSGPIAVMVDPFNPTVCNDPDMNCAVQPGTNANLDVLSDRPMYRLAYRNFGRIQSMVVNHTVQTPGQIPGIRWYEIRMNNQGTAIVYQQGTYTQQDGNARWMGSMAMDKNGNIALGYSVSGPSLFPSIRYTGREFYDPRNTMRTELTIANGGGSQLAGNRWGDYSSMAIDPSDDCTFWYTTEYIQTSGNYNWSTVIASFKFPTCR